MFAALDYVGLFIFLQFPSNNTEPTMVLGEAFVPGDDRVHFCKPTDVVVAKSGEIFVADGYCNSRVVKFSKDGKFLAEIGKGTQ